MMWMMTMMLMLAALVMLTFVFCCQLVLRRRLRAFIAAVPMRVATAGRGKTCNAQTTA